MRTTYSLAYAVDRRLCCTCSRCGAVVEVAKHPEHTAFHEAAAALTHEPCPVCDGTGLVDAMGHICDGCQGTGLGPTK